MKKILILFILSFTFLTSSKATHLMGGEITWECIKSGSDAGKYIFTVKVYRDCQGVPISTTMGLDVHNVPGLTYIPLQHTQANDISPACNTVDGPNSAFSCNGINQGFAGNGVGAVEEHIYESQPIRIDGTPDSYGWHFTWTSCCRNNAITNIANPGGQSFTLRAVMYSYTDSLGVIHPNNNNCHDSSPQFYEKPRTILESGNGYDPLAFSNGFVYSHNAFDHERDSLRYDFADPLNSFYDFMNPSASAIQITGNYGNYSPLSNSNPIPGVQINHETGRTYYPADYVGNFVTCTRVEAWKCGQLVAEVYREIQVVLSAPICNLGDTTGGNVGADTLCNVRPLVQPPFFFPLGNPQYQWDTIVHCGDTVSFDFIANDYDVYPNGSLQNLQFTVSGGQFLDYSVSPPASCNNPPCATFEELSTGATPPFITTGGNGVGYFEWITSCNHVINNCGGELRPSLYTFVIKVQDDFCPAPAIENTAQVVSIYVCPPCDSMKVNPTSTSASCNLPDGTISVSPSGGLPPYNAYYFDMNGIPVNPTGVSAGDYQVRVVDSSQCESVDTVTVFGNVPSFSVSSINVTCNGANNGSASAILGGSPPYNYIWSNGDTTQTISSLSPGLYSVSVMDSTGCSLSDSILITEPDLLIIDSAVINNLVCFGANNGSIDISVVGGTPSYSYSWSTGDTSEDISSLIAGTYSVSITDLNQCSSTSYSYTILEPTQIQNFAITTSTLCFGDNNGSIDISVSGGTPSYSFSWSTGDTTEDISSLTAGNYSVIITDSNSCVLYDTITVLEPLQITAALTAAPSTLTGIVSGGSVPYSLTIYDPTNTFFASSTNNFGTSFTVNPLISGQYCMVTTDVNGCTDTTCAVFSFPTNVNNALSEDIRIYPNPTQDRVIIDFDFNVKDLSISIYDILGKSIYYQNQFFNLSSQEIMLDEFEDGSYLIIMDVDGVVYHHQIIVHK